MQDFYLDLSEDGHKISARDYLESALQPINGTGKAVAAKNEVLILFHLSVHVQKNQALIISGWLQCWIWLSPELLSAKLENWWLLVFQRWCNHIYLWWNSHNFWRRFCFWYNRFGIPYEHSFRNVIVLLWCALSKQKRSCSTWTICRCDIISWPQTFPSANNTGTVSNILFTLSATMSLVGHLVVLVERITENLKKPLCGIHHGQDDRSKDKRDGNWYWLHLIALCDFFRWSI